MKLSRKLLVTFLCLSSYRPMWYKKMNLEKLFRSHLWRVWIFWILKYSPSTLFIFLGLYQYCWYFLRTNLVNKRRSIPQLLGVNDQTVRLASLDLKIVLVLSHVRIWKWFFRKFVLPYSAGDSFYYAKQWMTTVDTNSGYVKLNFVDLTIWTQIAE